MSSLYSNGLKLLKYFRPLLPQMYIFEKYIRENRGSNPLTVFAKKLRARRLRGS